jgi:uncharacterized protein YpbB
VRATLKQIPLRLAWAITIHKSQGMTLDAAEIDLGDAFEPGMGYVALSRVRSLSGLKLMNLNEMALKVHPKILQQDEIFKEQSVETVNYLQTLSQEEQTEDCKKTLVTFGSGKRKSAGKKKTGTKKVPTHLITLEMLKEQLSLEAIAKKRELAIVTILGHIEKLKSYKMIDPDVIENLKEMIPKEDFKLILAEFKKSEDGKLTPIYDKFSGKYSYNWIQLVRLFVGSE